MNRPTVTVIMPVYNVEKYVGAAISSVLKQTYPNFELLIVDDAGSDRSIKICRQFQDPRIRIISQENRGLAGARNTGIRKAVGKYIAFLDADDLWSPEKLARHVEHLNAHPRIGLSYAASRMIDDYGRTLAVSQSPKLRRIKPETVYLRNPIGNGSAPVIRREVFEDIAHESMRPGENNFFDESFRQSEDIECWVRIALTTSWEFEGISGAYTLYRVNSGGLSANVIRQFETWERVRDRVRQLDPVFAKRWEAAAEAYQLRYLARRSIRMLDRGMSISLMFRALARRPHILVAEPLKTINTLAAAILLRALPVQLYANLQTRLVGA